MYIPLIWQFRSDVKKGEGYKVVKKNVISTFSSVANFSFILKGIIQGLLKIYNLRNSTSRSNKNWSIKFNAATSCLYSSQMMKSSQRRKMILPMNLHRQNHKKIIIRQSNKKKLTVLKTKIQLFSYTLVIFFRIYNFIYFLECDSKTDWLRVQSPFEEMNYLLKFIFPFFALVSRQNRSVKCCHSTFNAFKIWQKVGNKVS